MSQQSTISSVAFRRFLCLVTAQRHPERSAAQSRDLAAKQRLLAKPRCLVKLGMTWSHDSELLGRNTGRNVLAAAFVIALLVPFPAQAAPPAKPGPGSVAELTKQAMQLERAKKPLEAAKVYEQIAARDSTRKSVVARRLVRIYATHGFPKQALEWAKVVMETNPDPQAYLAGVYTLMKNYTAAQEILEKEIKKAKEPVKKLTLNWQLASVFQAQEQLDKAEELLKAAAESVKGTVHEKTARKRLDAFLKKREAVTKEEGDHTEPK